MNYVIVAMGQKSELTAFRGNKDEVVAWLLNQTDVKGYSIREESSTTYYTIKEFFSRVVNVVSKFYQMNPESEDLLPGAHCLANGMKVLIGSSNDRGRPEETDKDWVREKVLVANRWCTVTGLEIINNFVRFIGVYDDGTKYPRTASAYDTWLVKKDSIKKSRIEDTKRYQAVYEIVKGTFVEHDEELGLGDDQIIRAATKKILGSIG